MERISETSAYKIQTPGRWNSVPKRLHTKFKLPEDVTVFLNVCTQNSDAEKMERISETSAYKIQTPGRWNSVPKRRYIKFISRVITEKKEYNIHDAVKV